MQENFLARWLNNELSQEELSKFKETNEYLTYKKIVDFSSKLEAPAYNTEEALDQSKINRNAKIIRLNPIRKKLQIAAVVLVLITGSYFFINSLDKNVITGYAENKTLTLPDSSTVTLNSVSEITFNKNNWDTNRNLTLEGEAFFKVAKGKKFTVNTSQGIATVLGTQFNVENRTGFFEVTCYEGSVSVYFNGETTILPAGNSFLAIDNEVIITDISGVNDTQTPSWLLNESSFKSIPLKYVLNEFERQFDTKIETKNINTSILFTGTISNKNKEIALKSICAPYQINYKIEKNKVLLYLENQTK